MNVWTFHFAEGNVQSRVLDGAENDRIKAEIDRGAWVDLGGEMNVRVNLAMTKAVTHEFVTPEQIKAAEEAKATQEVTGQISTGAV